MITVTHLTKRYGPVVALDDISFTVSSGSVVGLLGPNGAGKSTCLRSLAGLVRPDAGTATTPSSRPHTAGFLLSTDTFHRGRTGRETLRLASLMLGLPMSRVDEVLDEVGLSGQEARRRVGTYSLGMRQRLGLAHALLAQPAVLVVDEPHNGLDPEGQRWLNALVRRHAERGGCVLLSSHHLHDVARVADRVLTIAHGRLLADDPVLDASALERRYFDLTAGADRAAA